MSHNAETPMDENPEIVDAASDADSTWETFIYHQRRALEEAGKALDALLPEGFKSHGSEAGKSFIKGFQVLVDAAIAEIEKATSKVEGADDAEADQAAERLSTTGKTKVKVEVE